MKTPDQITAEYAEKIKALEAERDREIAAAKAALNQPWRPEVGQGYKYVGNNGIIIEDSWQGYGIDLHRLVFGNVYPPDTDDAERARDRQLALVRLLRLPGARRGFHENKQNWAVYNLRGKFRTSRMYFNNGCPVFFDTEGQAEAALASNLEDFKLVCGVEGRCSVGINL